MTPARGLELALWSVFATGLAVYLAALWREEPRLRARAYPAALFLGVAALFASAGVHRLGPLLSPAAVLYPLSFLTGALALGAVATGMLLGHWYLIDIGLSIEPLQRLFRYFVAVLLLHLAVLTVTLAVMSLAPGPGTAAVTTLWHEHRSLLAARFLSGLPDRPHAPHPPDDGRHGPLLHRDPGRDGGRAARPADPLPDLAAALSRVNRRRGSASPGSPSTSSRGRSPHACPRAGRRSWGWVRRSRRRGT